MSEWNPDLYLKFEAERTQPAKDLIFHIRKEDPGRIIDIGCGPGNSTNELRKRWENAQIIGLDSSEAMLEKARKEHSNIEWVAYDANKDLSHLGKFDIVFSNAAIQWLPDHNKLLKRFFSMINESGVLAVQLPNTTNSPVKRSTLETTEEARWRESFKNMKTDLHFEELGYYYDILSPLADDIDLWETHYNHIVPGHEAIIEWYKPTGLKPYLSMLNERDQEAFISDVLNRIRMEYKPQNDGRILFPMRRIFFVAYKKK